MKLGMFRHRNTKYLLAISLVSILFVFGASNEANAHFGDQLSGYGTATVDGIQSSGEWDAATKIPVFAGELSGSTLRVMNDEKNLYFALSVVDDTLTSDDRFEIRFDNSHNGVLDVNDDSGGFTLFPLGLNGAIGKAISKYYGAITIRDGHFDGTNWIGDQSTHGIGAVQKDGIRNFIEFSKPLASGDASDINLSIGDTVGICVTYFKDGTATSNTQFGPNCRLLSQEQNLYGDVILISSPPVIGPTIIFDSNIYTWTDKVSISVFSPDHNTNNYLIDLIGEPDNSIRISTDNFKLDDYILVETDTDTGIFAGAVFLTGFLHDADGNPSTGDASGFDGHPLTHRTGIHDGYLQADGDDKITVSFEFNPGETVEGSALISWNIGQVQWLEASYPATGTGVVRVVDPDMNMNPNLLMIFNVTVRSDSDPIGIDLTVVETDRSTGIFLGTVTFTTTEKSSGNRLRVSEGDTITAVYEDNTLPAPSIPSDVLDIIGTVQIGSDLPPLPHPILDKEIPEWIKDQAKWWINGAISDREFIQSFEYLIKNEIIYVQNIPEPEQIGKAPIPSFFKNNVKWWINGQIHDFDFAKGLEYLIKVGVIVIQKN